MKKWHKEMRQVSDGKDLGKKSFIYKPFSGGIKKKQALHMITLHQAHMAN